jgi:hypothetical protein
VRSDGQAPGTFLVGEDNAGPIGGELTFRTFDDKFEAALKNDWDNTPVRDNNGTADSVITNVATTNTEVTHTTGAAFVASQLVLFAGFGVSGNNVLAKCTTGGATSSRYVGSGITDETAPPANARMKAVGFVGASGDITATTVGGNALLATTLDFTAVLPANMAGRWVIVGGRNAGEKFATAADSGLARVSAVTAGRLSFDVVPSGWATDAGTGKTIHVYVPDFLFNGTKIYDYSWERRQLDATGGVLNEYFIGEFLDKMSLPSSAGKELNLNMDWLGLSGIPMSTTRVSGATDIAANSYQTMTSFSNTLQLAEGGVSLLNGVNCISDSSIDIANNLERVQVEGGYVINVGAFMASGKFNGYLGDGSIMAKSSNNTLSSFNRLNGYVDGNKEGYLFDCPAARYKITSDIPGANQGRKIEGTFDAEPHPTLGYTMSICRFWYRP